MLMLYKILENKNSLYVCVFCLLSFLQGKGEICWVIRQLERAALCGLVAIM